MKSIISIFVCKENEEWLTFWTLDYTPEQIVTVLCECDMKLDGSQEPSEIKWRYKKKFQKKLLTFKVLHHSNHYIDFSKIWIQLCQSMIIFI